MTETSQPDNEQEPKVSWWRNKRASEKPDRNDDCHEVWEAVVVWPKDKGGISQ